MLSSVLLLPKHFNLEVENIFRLEFALNGKTEYRLASDMGSSLVTNLQHVTNVYICITVRVRFRLRV